MPGPIPNRSGDLSRERDANRSRGDRPTLTKGVAREAKIPGHDPKWERAVIRLYATTRTSGQADFYQSSDWSFFWIQCDLLDRVMKSDRPSAQMVSAIMSSLASFGLTEGDRRRMRIELEAPQEETEDASVTAISDARKKLGVAK